MSVLTREAILAEMNAGRLVVTPFHADQLGAADPALDLLTLRPRALVVPQDRRPQHLAGIVEQHQAVHLPGQANPDDRLGGDAGGGEQLADRPPRRAPPEGRILLRPERLRLRLASLLERLERQLEVRARGRRR